MNGTLEEARKLVAGKIVPLKGVVSTIQAIAKHKSTNRGTMEGS
jgi:hypothetical protein